MEIQTKCAVIDDYMGVPDFIDNDTEHYNTMWGSDYIVLFGGEPSEKTIERCIEGMIMMRLFSVTDTGV